MTDDPLKLRTAIDRERGRAVIFTTTADQTGGLNLAWRAPRGLSRSEAHAILTAATAALAELLAGDGDRHRERRCAPRERRPVPPGTEVPTDAVQAVSVPVRTPRG